MIEIKDTDMPITVAEKIINGTKNYDNASPMAKAFYKAITGKKMAIKALSAEPCEDCISRQAMHIELEKWITYGEYKYSNATKYLYDRIDRLPPVTLKPKTDVLDKIKAEIEEQVLESLSDGGDDWFVAEKVNECLEIIDKYKAEKE